MKVSNWPASRQTVPKPRPVMKSLNAGESYTFFKAAVSVAAMSGGKPLGPPMPRHELVE